MPANRFLALAVIAVCQVAAMALWFSASAVVPALKAAGAIDPQAASLFTSAVQAGFVAGTLTSAFFGLADRIDPRKFFMASALVAAAANGAILLIEPSSPLVVALRFVTGACMGSWRRSPCATWPAHSSVVPGIRGCAISCPAATWAGCSAGARST
jgi:MFS family permease